MIYPPRRTEASLDHMEIIWRGQATIDKQKFLVIVKDLEEGDIYPMYFKTESKMNEYQANIISETKVKVLKVLEIEND